MIHRRTGEYLEINNAVLVEFRELQLKGFSPLTLQMLTTKENPCGSYV
jgi:hypothetical protein